MSIRQLAALYRVRLAACIAACVTLTACSGDPMRLESEMRGDLAGSIKLEGPLQIQAQLQGPTIKYEGTYVSDELLEEVQVSKTTGDWILAVLGRPDAESPLRDGTQIWRWTYRPVEQQVSIVELWGKTEKEPKLATRTPSSIGPFIPAQTAARPAASSG